MTHGLNRLSLGMQAVQPHHLITLGRIHTHSQVEAAVCASHEAGLWNLNLDLMFGLPKQTPAEWQESLEAALSLSPTHLSCYGLIPEEGTPLMADLAVGRLALPEVEVERQMYDDCIRLLSRHGYQQYEISNFAKEGYACQHNLGYWRQVPYLGLGASASSMLRDATGESFSNRITNPVALEDYITMVSTKSWDTRETLTIDKKEACFETMMLGLRTTQGIREADFLTLHGVSMTTLYGSALQAAENQGLMIHENGIWRLTRQGMDLQNTVLLSFMED